MTGQKTPDLKNRSKRSKKLISEVKERLVQEVKIESPDISFFRKQWYKIQLFFQKHRIISQFFLNFVFAMTYGGIIALALQLIGIELSFKSWIASSALYYLYSIVLEDKYKLERIKAIKVMK